MAPARLLGVLRDEEGSPWLLHVSGVYSEMRRDHRGSCTSQGSTHGEGVGSNSWWQLMVSLRDKPRDEGWRVNPCNILYLYFS